MLGVVLVVALFEFPTIVTAYSWNFQATPQQCNNMTIEITGTDGTPPYRFLLIPFGASPFSNNTEVRRITDKVFDDGATSLTFTMAYPANSQYVAVVSDSSAFGSGGTSIAATVADSDDTSCYNATENVAPDYTFSIDPANQVVQCQQMRIYWDNTTVDGTPNFLGVIPGGQSFAIPEGTIDDEHSQGLGTGFFWTPNVRGGTTLLMVGGDSRGNGTGGSVLNTVSSGTSNNSTCLSSDSPSSTAGTPAGGSLPTSSSSSSPESSGSSGGGTNTGAIVGGVVGGVVGVIALLLVFLLLRRRQKLGQQQREKPVDLIHDDEAGDDAHHPAQRNDLPQYYEPEPFMVPDPTIASDEESHFLSAADRRYSGISTSRSGTPDLMSVGASSTAGGMRKGGMPRLRPVNIIQHDDAGPSEPIRQEEPETIELPPAYNKIQGTPAATPSSQDPPAVEA